MATVAGYCLGAAEVCFIDVQDHFHHLASDSFFLLIIAFPDPIIATGLRVCPIFHMTVVAVDTKRIADDIHHEKELRLRKPFEHLYVFASLIDGLFLLRGASDGKCEPLQLREAKRTAQGRASNAAGKTSSAHRRYLLRKRTVGCPTCGGLITEPLR